MLLVNWNHAPICIQPMFLSHPVSLADTAMQHNRMKIRDPHTLKRLKHILPGARPTCCPAPRGVTRIISSNCQSWDQKERLSAHGFFVTASLMLRLSRLSRPAHDRHCGFTWQKDIVEVLWQIEADFKRHFAARSLWVKKLSFVAHRATGFSSLGHPSMLCNLTSTKNIDANHGFASSELLYCLSMHTRKKSNQHDLLSGVFLRSGPEDSFHRHTQCTFLCKS